MDKNAIKKYAVWARNELIARVTQKAEQYEITEKKTTPKDADSINGRLLTDAEKNQRKALIEKIQADGFEQVMEEVAYTWFNRFTALRFMEVNNYLPSHTRVFTNEAGEFKPQILADAIQLDLEGLDMDKVFELKDANKTEELYKYLLITQCNALSAVLPRMFQKIEHYTELLLPDYLLREGSVIEQMISMIPEDSFDVNTEGGQIEILGWLYQYYISEKHEEVVDPLHGKVVKKEEVPAATQLFTTDWVVRYLIDNSVGRYWIERNPNSMLADNLTYFVKPKNGIIKTVDEKITPQDVTTFDPCVGSGHFLIYAFDVLMKIYIEYGYSERDAASEIVKNNLFGLDIDGRAAQLAYFSVMMKARQYDRRFFSRDIQPHIFEITESNNADKLSIEYFYGKDAFLKKDIKTLLETLKDAKEYGSILQIPGVDFERINERFIHLSGEINMYNTYLLNDFQELVRPAEIMSKKYAVVATNPPYLNKYDPKLKSFIYDHYKDYSGDLFSVFMYRNFEYCIKDGYTGFMTPFVWMFIKTYEAMRKVVINSKSLISIIQMEYSAYEEATVPICTFVLRNCLSHEKALCIKLSDFKGGMDVQRKKTEEALIENECDYFYEASQSDFMRIPGCPIAYWASEAMISMYEKNKLNDFGQSRKGMATGWNAEFVRYWYEVNAEKIGHVSSRTEAAESKYKWFPYASGGEFRKWFGNNLYVVNWENDGFRLQNEKTEDGSRLRAVNLNLDYIFREGFVWTSITSSGNSFRLLPKGGLFSSASNAWFPKMNDDLLVALAFVNSKPVEMLLKMSNPTLNANPNDIGNLPIDKLLFSNEELREEARVCIDIAKADWDQFEISMDFYKHPLIRKLSLISEAFNEWSKECDERFYRMLDAEAKINEIFINAYGLEAEMDAVPNTEDICVRKANLSRDIKGLISYAVGCMFGRYSLDEGGVVYAGGDWDLSPYISYRADSDGIIPVCDDEYFDDDIVGCFVKFIEVAFGKETLEENLKFIADALGGKGTSREVIRTYFMNDFYIDHLKIYQKRPIYWLFDSGKKNGFKALVYMHRYQPDTIARIRTDYVHEQQSRYRTAIADLENRINGAATSDRVKLNRQLNTLQAQANEIKTYEEKIHHLADQMLKIDMDDGVKQNYEIFQDVLAKIK